MMIKPVKMISKGLNVAPIQSAEKAKRACARFARQCRCRKCLYFGTCKHLEKPYSLLGRYVAHVEEVCENASRMLPHNAPSWAGRVTLLPTALEDDAGILAKIKVNAGKHYRTILLTGSESDYIIIKQIMKAWREAYLRVE